jgi:hypothetical protein
MPLSLGRIKRNENTERICTWHGYIVEDTDDTYSCLVFLTNVRPTLNIVEDLGTVKCTQSRATIYFQKLLDAHNKRILEERSEKLREQEYEEGMMARARGPIAAPPPDYVNGL